MAARPSFAPLVDGCGLGFLPVPGDPQGLIRDWPRAASRDEVRALTASGPAPLARTLGTTGAGLRVGVPAVPVPVMADQPFWASRLVGLGDAPRVLPFEEQELTSEALGSAITDCLSDPALRRRASALARGIAAEDGAAAPPDRIGSALPS